MNRQTIAPHTSNARTPLALALLLAVAATTTAGCVRVKKRFPDKRYYALEAERAGESYTPVRGANLAVRSFQEQAGRESKEFVYRLGGSRYESDFYNEFFAEPNALVTEQARRWIVDAGLFENVVSFSSHAEPTHILEGSVTAILADYSDESAPKAILEIQFFLLEAKGEPTIVFRETYREETPISAATPDALIEGWNASLQKILTAFENNLKQIDLRTE